MAIPTGSPHYKGGSVEPLELIEAQGLGFHLGNVVKYAVRAEVYYRDGSTNWKTVQDNIDKAIWYLQRFKDVYSPERGVEG